MTRSGLPAKVKASLRDKTWGTLMPLNAADRSSEIAKVSYLGAEPDRSAAQLDCLATTRPKASLNSQVFGDEAASNRLASDVGAVQK